MDKYVKWTHSHKIPQVNANAFQIHIILFSHKATEWHPLDEISLLFRSYVCYSHIYICDLYITAIILLLSGNLQQRLYISEQLNLELRHNNEILKQQLESIVEKEMESKKTDIHVT